VEVLENELLDAMTFLVSICDISSLQHWLLLALQPHNLNAIVLSCTGAELSFLLFYAWADTSTSRQASVVARFVYTAGDLDDDSLATSMLEPEAAAKAVNLLNNIVWSERKTALQENQEIRTR
jgi:hypothetical protein